MPKLSSHDIDKLKEEKAKMEFFFNLNFPVRKHRKKVLKLLDKFYFPASIKTKDIEKRNAYAAKCNISVDELQERYENLDSTKRTLGLDDGTIPIVRMFHKLFKRGH